MDGSTNESSQDGGASDQIISDIRALPCEQELIVSQKKKIIDKTT